LALPGDGPEHIGERTYQARDVATDAKRSFVTGVPGAQPPAEDSGGFGRVGGNEFSSCDNAEGKPHPDAVHTTGRQRPTERSDQTWRVVEPS